MNSDIVLHDQQTTFAHYKVVDTTYEGRPARLLYGDDQTTQSGLAKDDNPDLLFDYNQRFLELATDIHPKKTLVIGGGAYTLPAALLEGFKTMLVDVVELDLALEPIARQFFGLPTTPRLRIFNTDGREFIGTHQQNYDLIIVDAFIGYEVPRQLTTAGAVARYRANLAPNGVVAMNFISAYRGVGIKLAAHLQTTLHRSFTNADLYPAGLELPFLASKHNLLVIAYDGAHRDFKNLRPQLLPPLLTTPDDAL